MIAIGDRQVKAARALLNWSQNDLAEAARLSIATIRKLELGYISPRCTTMAVIKEAFEKAGVEFLDCEGVRRRQEDIATFRGAGAGEAFLNDMTCTANRNGGEIMIVAASAFGLSSMFGTNADTILEDMVLKNDRITAKVILMDAFITPVAMPRLEYRVLSTNYVESMPFCVYGDKYAMVASNQKEVIKIVVVQSAVAALSSRRQFYSMWDKSMQFQGSDIGAKRRILAGSNA